MDNKNFPYKCTRCGFCCLHEPCQISKDYDLWNGNSCKAFNFGFNRNQAFCKLAKIIPDQLGINKGCCIDARAYKDGIEYDFSSLPFELKRVAAYDLLLKNKGVKSNESYCKNRT